MKQYQISQLLKCETCEHVEVCAHYAQCKSGSLVVSELSNLEVPILRCKFYKEEKPLIKGGHSISNLELYGDAENVDFGDDATNGDIMKTILEKRYGATVE